MEETDVSDQLTFKSWSRSHSNVIRLEHTWIVENLSLQPQKNGACSYSPIFSHPSEKQAEWKLQLYPKGETEESKDHISLFLRLHNPQKAFQLNASHRLTLLSKNQNILAGGDSCMKEFANAGWGYTKMLKLDKISPTNFTSSVS